MAADTNNLRWELSQATRSVDPRKLVVMFPSVVDWFAAKGRYRQLHSRAERLPDPLARLLRQLIAAYGEPPELSPLPSTLSKDRRKFPLFACLDSAWKPHFVAVPKPLRQIANYWTIAPDISRPDVDSGSNGTSEVWLSQSEG